jgi:hypothetical protein
VTRSGKNLFADIASQILLDKYKLTSKSFALAYYVKKDCEEFVKEKLGLNVWSEVTSEKDIFRPLLVWYSGVKRKQSEGRHWVEMLDNDMKSCESDVKFITDVRFSVYDKDETYWLKNEMSGKLIHISKYSMLGMNTNRFSEPQKVKKYTDPANDQEMINDPVVKRCSDYQLEWEDVGSKYNGSYASMLNDVYLRNEVSAALSTIIDG